LTWGRNRVIENRHIRDRDRVIAVVVHGQQHFILGYRKPVVAHVTFDRG
jgi:hypothetical protein